jgi:hypothetical protein
MLECGGGAAGRGGGRVGAGVCAVGTAMNRTAEERELKLTKGCNDFFLLQLCGEQEVGRQNFGMMVDPRLRFQRRFLLVRNKNTDSHSEFVRVVISSSLDLIQLALLKT